MLLRDVCLQWPWNVISGECYETLLKASKTEADFVLGRSVGMPSEKKSFFFFCYYSQGAEEQKMEQKKRESKEPPLPVPNERVEWEHKHLSGRGEREDNREVDRRGAGGVKCPDSGVHR